MVYQHSWENWLKFHFLRHRLTVFVAEVAVCFHCQRPAVLVTEPARDRGNIHAGFNAAGGK